MKFKKMIVQRRVDISQGSILIHPPQCHARKLLRCSLRLVPPNWRANTTNDYRQHRTTSALTTASLHDNNHVLRKDGIPQDTCTRNKASTRKVVKTCETAISKKKKLLRSGRIPDDASEYDQLHRKS